MFDMFFVVWSESKVENGQGENKAILDPSLISPFHLYADALTVCRPLVSVPGEGLHPHRSDTTTETPKPKVGCSCSCS